jgi:membrane-associated protease RseP (regulator of RpoE activity)
MDTEKGQETVTQDNLDVPSSLVTQLREAVEDVFAVEDVTHGIDLRAKQGKKGLRLRGQLLVPAQEAHKIIAPRFEALGHTAFLRRIDGWDVIYAAPGVVRPSRSKRWVNVVLFVITVLSVLFTGAVSLNTEAEALSELLLFGLTHLHLGLPAALALLMPLLAHELGHYLTARHFGLAATLPYFIPLPFPISPLGTMGAVIRMKGPMPNRKTLLAVGAAGPLAGFVIAVPILILGLALSPVTDFDPQTGVGIPEDGVLLEGNSLLYGGVKMLMFGQWLPGGGKDVFLHPIAFSAWAALLVTAINLIPAGQLDGGHIAYALLGDNARRLTQAMLVLTLIMGFLWQGWWLWSVLIWFFGQRHASPLEDITPLTTRQRLLAVILLIIFVLTFIPVPLQVIVPPSA